MTVKKCTNIKACCTSYNCCFDNLAIAFLTFSLPSWWHMLKTPKVYWWSRQSRENSSDSILLFLTSTDSLLPFCLSIHQSSRSLHLDIWWPRTEFFVLLLCLERHPKIGQKIRLFKGKNNKDPHFFYTNNFNVYIRIRGSLTKATLIRSHVHQKRFKIVQKRVRFSWVLGFY